MALTKEVKQEIVKKYGKNAQDTGSTEVQIALLTKEIEQLNAHIDSNIHDFASKRGLLIKVGQRRSLLAYLKKNNPDSYSNLIKSLGLRR